jgi:hypothetical protein
MSSTNLIAKDLLQVLGTRFPQVRLGDAQGMSTASAKDAVFFDFDFTIDGEKIASISISLAEKGALKLFYSRDILKDQGNAAKNKWFTFLKDMRSFAMSRLLSFDPKDIAKKTLDKRDYKNLASTNTDQSKDNTMSESSLYGSTRSSYQALENTKLIIRHSKQIQEESPNSRTRNIEALYIQSGDGERFKYPFVHLAGARAMQRHVANEGNPYDNFGQYIVSLSEQVFNLRRFNNLMSRNAFLENTEVADIAVAARQKVQEVKKTLERIQKQGGYNDIKENFTIFVKRELDAQVLEDLKNRFTIQQFNEELVELFPYITDLLGEEGILGELSPVTLSSYKSKAGNSEKKFTDKSSTLSVPVKDRNVAALKAHQRRQGMKLAIKKLGEEDQIDEVSKELAKKVQLKRAQNYAAADNNPTGGSPEEEKAWDKYKKNTALMHKRSKMEVGGTQSVGWPQDDVSEAGKKGDKKVDEPTDADRADEPWDYNRYGSDPETERNEITDLERAVTSAPQIAIEPYSKEFIQKALDVTQRQIKDLEKKAAENPRDNKTKWALEKAQARLGLFHARLATADPKVSNVITKNGLLIDHLAKHIKDDKISLLLSRISDDYAEMSKADQKKVVELVNLIKSKQKLVSPFTAESTTFEELENVLGSENATESTGKDLYKYDPVIEYIRLLDGELIEDSELQNPDEDVKKQALDKLNKLMADHFPVGTNGINAIESLKDIIDDPELNNEFKELSQEDADLCARPAIMAWIENNAPEIANQVDTGNMDQDPKNPSKSDQTEPAEEPAPEEKPSEPSTEESMEETDGTAEIEEYIKSLYDYTTGHFPRGETGVIESVKKKFGDGAVEHAKSFVAHLKHSFDENLLRMKKIASEPEHGMQEEPENTFENLARIKALSGLK